MASYGTVEELKVRIGFESDLSEEKETAYEEILEAMSRKIDNFCNVDANYFITAGVVDPDIREACLSQAAVLIKRFEGAMSTSLGSSDYGNLKMRIQHSAMNRDVKELLVDGRHVRPLYGRPSS
jgi:hypothetical protein